MKVVLNDLARFFAVMAKSLKKLPLKGLFSLNVPVEIV
jgi:hypothetical protein